MQLVFRLLHWHLALAGLVAVVQLHLGFGEPVMAVALAFALAGLLSTLRPERRLWWAALAGGAAAISEVISAVDPAAAADSAGHVAVLCALSLAVGIAGAAAGSAMPVRVSL